MGKTKQPVKFRIARPNGSHKTFRFQEKKEGSPGWRTRQLDDLDTVNSLFLAGTLSYADAQKRAALIREAEYAKRDKEAGRAALTMLPGNLKILENFKAEKYDRATIKRMRPRSYTDALYLLKKGVECLALLPIDGPSLPIQDLLDEIYDEQHNLHKKRTMAINRIRGWLGLNLIKHLSLEKKPVVYIPYNEFKVRLPKCPEPERTFAAVAFFAGLRPSEMVGLSHLDIRGNGNVLAVDRQLQPEDEKPVLPKNRKTRKAFVMPEGVVWVKALVKMNDRSYEPSIVRQHFGVGLYDLRHSYAVHLIGKGATLDWISQSMGHSRETCERHYAGHVLTTDSITLLDQLFAEKKKPSAARATKGKSKVKV